MKTSVYLKPFFPFEVSISCLGFLLEKFILDMVKIYQLLTYHRLS